MVAAVMNAINSYLRHLIVTGITLLIAKFKLPLEGADKFADAIALLVIATITWGIVKYAPPSVAKFLGLSAVALCVGIGFSSCAGLEIVTHTPYGSGSYQDGVMTVTPNPTPIAIPIHATK